MSSTVNIDSKSSTKQTTPSPHSESSNLLVASQNTWLYIIIFVCLLPTIFNLTGIDFSSSVEPILIDESNKLLIISGTLHHTILEWTAVIVAILTFVLAIAHYRIHHDIVIPIMGVAILCTSAIDTFHILSATHMIAAKITEADFAPLTWALSRIFNAGIVIIATFLCFMIYNKKQSKKLLTQSTASLSQFNESKALLLITLGFITLTVICLYLVINSTSLPQTLFPNAVVTRPYDVLPLGLFILAGSLFINLYNKYPSLAKYGILLSIIPEITSQLHMVFGSSALFDNHFNIAHTLKITAYGCVFIAILFDLKESPKLNSAKDEDVNTTTLSTDELSTDKVITQRSVNNEKLLNVGYARYSISVQIPVAAFILVVSVTTLVSVLFYFETERLLSQKIINEVAIESELVEPLIEQLYSKASSDVLFLSQTPPIQGILKASFENDMANKKIWQQRLEQIFSQFISHNKFYYQIRYIGLDNNGKELINIRNDKPELVTANAALQNKSEQPYFDRVLNKHSGEVYFSKVELAKSHGEVEIPYKATLRVATPIYNNNTGQAFGFVIINIDFEAYISSLKKNSLSQLSFYLTNKEGDFISHPDSNKEFGFNLGKRYLIQDEFPPLAPIIKDNIKIFSIGNMAIKDKQYLGHYHRVNIDDFDSVNQINLLVLKDRSEIESMLADNRMRSFLLGTTLAVISLAIAIMVARRISNPLSQITQSIKNYEQTNNLTNLPINSRTEIGVLSRSFHNLFTEIQLILRAQEKDQQTLLEVNERISLATDAAEIGVWQYDILNNKLSWDTWMHKLHETDPTTFQNSITDWEKSVHPDDYDTAHKTFILAIENKTSLDANFRIITPSGTIKHIKAIGLVKLNEQGIPVQITGVNFDVSERVMVEQEHIKAKEIAEDTARHKAEFLASMSHEIRTPMNGILGMLGLLLRNELTDDQRHKVQLANSSAQALLLLINDILDFSKIEAGKLDLEVIDFDLRKLFGDFTESLALKAQQKNIELILDSRDINHSHVKGDPGRIRQILNNLIGNAIKFTDSGEILITAGLSEKNEKLILNCSVSDTGIGIKENKIPYLFQSFTQVDASTTRKYGGTGLGLAICKQLCQLMQGDMQVVSTLDQGSTFSFTINLEKSEKSRPVLPDVDITQVSILLIDGNQTNRRVLKEQLEQWGATVLEADSGQKGFALLAKNNESSHFTKGETSTNQTVIVNRSPAINIVFINKYLADMSSEIIAQQITINNNLDDIKFVMMTSMADNEDAEYFARLGCATYFPKPVITKDLFRVLNIYCSNKDDIEPNNLAKNHASKNHTDKNNSDKKKQEMHLTIANTHNNKASHHDTSEDNVFNQCKVLLVEDNRINQEVAKHILAEFNIQADIAINGLEALNAISATKNTTPYDIVLMDCQMPEMDGYEATIAIRNGDAGIENKTITIIAMTANAMKGDREKCLDSGMTDYLSKPIDPIEIKNKLLQYCPTTISVQPCSTEKIMNNDNNVVQNNQQQKQLNVIHPDNKKTDENQVTSENEALIIWDKLAFNKRLNNNKMIEHKLIALFLEEAPKQLIELESSIKNNDNKLQHDISHKLQGMSGNLSAQALLKVTKDFNQYVKTTTPEQDQINTLFKAVQLSYIELEKLLQATLKA
ncbi:response regulator [Colwellia sp. E2M01]|uniref:response regulator n=1 Tax=Colwellia sp. E2M01 TaxID=2841561 RepID=UPI001C08B9AD|nr:response regulator [Colwellia sp. E2M01]MBU2871353.1 response regulator [Colwellia sp. E2M01]